MVAELIRALDCLLIPNDAVLMVHSSFRGMGREGFTPIEIAETLVDHFSKGTLLMPAMSWRYVTPAKPHWHELNTPSNTGILAEIFRKEIATHRSIHPTHSVAGIGHDVEGILDAHHHDDTPCSANSPFGQLCGKGGWVLLLGTGIDCCTVIHHAEELVAPDVYLRPEIETYGCEDRHGDMHIVRLRRHKLLSRDYWQFQDALAVAGKLRIATIGAVLSRAFRARDLLDITVTALRRDPECIIAHDGGRYRRM